MPFEKGQKKIGGRAKGTPNAINRKIGESVSKLLEDSLEGFKSDLDSLQPRERLQVVVSLMKFVLPTLKAQEVSVTTADQMPEWVGEILNDEYRSNV